MNEMEKIRLALVKAADEIQNRKNMKELAQISAEMVRERTRKGKGVSRRGSFVHNLADLEDSTIRRRERIKLHPETGPSKSNLTETGQMLDALYGKSKKKGHGDIAIRSKRKKKKGQKKEITNDEVAFFVSGKRPFIDLSNKEVNKLSKITAEKTQKLVDKFLKQI